MSAFTMFFFDALVSRAKPRPDNNFNLAQVMERDRFRKSMPGESAMTQATRLYSNGR